MNITIDGQRCEAEYGEFILDIARRNDIQIPTLCHSDALPGQANCRLCIVEVEDNGRRKVVTSCVFPVTKEIKVITKSPKIIAMRRMIMMLLAARVPDNAYLNRLKEEYSVPDITRFATDSNEQCILCGLCVRACEKVGPCAIATVNRGIAKKVSTPYDEPSVECIGCGACANVCPTGAIKVVDQGNERRIWNKKFELLSCSQCGKPFITREQLEYINSRLESQTDERLCEKCRKSLAADKFKDIYKNAPLNR